MMSMLHAACQVEQKYIARSVYPNLECFGNGLLYAFEPWSGHYEAGRLDLDPGLAHQVFRMAKTRPILVLVLVLLLVVVVVVVTSHLSHR